jgi:hypothetical protein
MLTIKEVATEAVTLIALLLGVLIFSQGAAAQEPEAPPAYTEQDVVMLSKMVWGEARGLPAEEQALCVWTVLNRLGDGRFGGSIAEILTKPKQFIGYRVAHPVTDEIRSVVEGVLQAWSQGATAPVLPPYAETSGYLYFSGKRGADGRMHNYFR